MFVNVLTICHVAISLVAIASGFVAVAGLLKNRLLAGWTTWFLTTTAITSLTGFLFPIHGLTPGLVLGVLSLIALGIATTAKSRWLREGRLRKTYVIAGIVSLYFNVFVLVVQLFEKVPALKAIAPTQKETPFKVAQLVTLLLFVTLAIFAIWNFRGKRLEVMSRAA